MHAPSKLNGSDFKIKDESLRHLKVRARIAVMLRASTGSVWSTVFVPLPCSCHFNRVHKNSVCVVVRMCVLLILLIIASIVSTQWVKYA